MATAVEIDLQLCPGTVMQDVDEIWGSLEIEEMERKPGVGVSLDSLAMWP